VAKLKTETRTIHNAGRLKVIGEFYSFKNKATVTWESQVERDLYYVFEYDRSVIKYVPQPRIFTIWVNGVSHKYTPDVEVTFADGGLRYQDAKAELPSEDSEMGLLLTAARIELHSQGYGFDVVPAATIRQGAIVTNIRLLYRYVQWAVPRNFPFAVAQALRAGPLQLWDLVQTVGKDDIASLYRLLFEQKIHMDMKADVLSLSTPIWMDAT
jgi:hypothetical protein